MLIKCAHCGKTADKRSGEVNRARAGGFRLYCNRRCSYLGRRQPPKTSAQLKLEKKLYDQEYRRRNLAMLKAKKRARHLRTYNPEKERVKRKAKMPRHVEYCRRPEYKRWKQGYDRKHRAQKFFGSFAEAAMLLTDLKRSINERATDHEIRQQNGTLNKVLQRRREAQAPERSRPRHRFQRRDRDPAVVGS